MPRILVLFASHFGQTRSIAERLADRLRVLGHEVELGDSRYVQRGLPPPEDYDAVVLGSRVERGRHAVEMYDYIVGHIEALRELPTAFFSVSMAAARPSASADPSGYMRTMFSELAWTPTRTVAFGGGLPYRKYGWIMRLVMKWVSRSADHPMDTSRNHEFTDWNRVEKFADEIAAMIPEPGALEVTVTAIPTAADYPRGREGMIDASPSRSGLS